MKVITYSRWVFIFLVHRAHPQEPVTDFQEKHIYVVNANTQTVEFTGNVLGLACWHYAGVQLCACLRGMCPEDRNKNMLVLTPEQRADFFMESMQTIEDYQQFCNSFSEEQWRQFYYNTTDKEKRFFPEHQHEVRLLADAIKEDATVHEAFVQTHPTSMVRKMIACGAGVVIAPFFLCISLATDGFKQGIKQTIQEVRKPFLEGTVDQEQCKTLFTRFKNYALS